MWRSARSVRALDAERRALFEAYVDWFNRRDWEALRGLVRADARLELVGEKRGDMSNLGATYSSNYTRLPWTWRLSVEDVAGEQAVVHWKLIDGAWHAHSAVRLWWKDGRVTRVRDYIHVDYLLSDWESSRGDPRS